MHVHSDNAQREGSPQIKKQYASSTTLCIFLWDLETKFSKLHPRAFCQFYHTQYYVELKFMKFHLSLLKTNKQYKWRIYIYRWLRNRVDSHLG